MYQKYHHLSILIPLLAVTLVFSSCGQDVQIREYEEIVIPSSLNSQMGAQADPHAFMNMPQGMDNDKMGTQADPHAFMNMPQGMEFPAGQDNAQIQKALDASVARPLLSWDTPEGWEEVKGSSSMRLATFTSKDKAIECSIVSLSGQAGGFEPNTIRWMNQINVAVLSGNQLKSFLSRQEVIKTKGEFSVKVIDLTELSQTEQSPSMIAGIAELKDMVIFVKMTGSKAAIIQNRESFLSLNQSLMLEK